MSTEKKTLRTMMTMTDLPKCDCFSTGNDAITWRRCCDVANASHQLSGAFATLANNEGVCSEAMPYMLDLAVITIVAYIAKAQGPALEYGSEEIQRESERLMAGLEARVLARMQETYAKARELGLTEEKVEAMRNGGTMQ